jgi:bifunctional non-homologous end joining protein LigD
VATNLRTSAAPSGATPSSAARGIFVNPFERGAACRMGLEGLVSKHRDRPYRGGRQFWIKVKDRNRPAMERESLETAASVKQPDINSDDAI